MRTTLSNFESGSIMRASVSSFNNPEQSTLKLVSLLLASRLSKLDESTVPALSDEGELRTGTLDMSCSFTGRFASGEQEPVDDLVSASVIEDSDNNQ